MSHWPAATAPLKGDNTHNPIGGVLLFRCCVRTGSLLASTTSTPPHQSDSATTCCGSTTAPHRAGREDKTHKVLCDVLHCLAAPLKSSRATVLLVLYFNNFDVDIFIRCIQEITFYQWYLSHFFIYFHRSCPTFLWLLVEHLIDILMFRTCWFFQ